MSQHRSAIVELAELLVFHDMRNARAAGAEHQDDFGTVVDDVGDIAIQLHGSGDTLPEDAFYFDSNCPPKSLRKGDTVLVIIIGNEHYVAGRGRLGDFGDRQAPTAVPTGFTALIPSAMAVPVGWIACDGEDFDAVRYDELETAIGSGTLPPDTVESGLKRIIRT